MRMKTAAAAVFAVTVMVLSSLAVGIGDSDADGTLIETAPLPAQKTYMYVIKTDSDNSKILSVRASENGSALKQITGARTSGSTGADAISDFWKFDPETGMGPFNSFYAAVNIGNGYGDDCGEKQISPKAGRISFVLDPYDLSRTLKGTEYEGNYNIMLIIPTAYWKASSDALYISSSPSYTAGTVKCTGMTAYAHSAGDGKTFKSIFPYIGIGVYEASIDGNLMMSKSGLYPTYTSNSFFAACAGMLTPASGSGFQMWNFYQWTLYKIMAYTVMGTKNSQAMLGRGFDADMETQPTGLSDCAGPYADATSEYSKLFIENSWGYLREQLGDTYADGGALYTGNALGGARLGDGQTFAGQSISLGQGWINSASKASEFWDFPVSYVSGSNSGDLSFSGDYVSCSSDRRLVNVGGGWNEKTGMAGIAELICDCDLSSTYSDVGTRLAYVMSADAAAPSTAPEYTPLTAGVPYKVTLDGYRDYATFRFTAPEDGIYRFWTSGMFSTTGVLLNSVGNRIKTDATWDDGLNFSMSCLLEGGCNYYLRTSSYGTDEKTFTVSAEFVSGPPMRDVHAFSPGTYALFRNIAKSSESNEMDIFVGYCEHALIGQFELGFEPENAVVTVYAYDVDEESGERNVIHLEDLTDGTETEFPAQYIHGSDSTWSTSTVTIDGRYLNSGHRYALYNYEMVDWWVVWIRDVAIQFAGGEYDLSLTASASGSDVETSLSGKLAPGSYEVEYGVYRTSDLVHLQTIHGSFAAGSDGRFAADMTFSMSGYDTGEYRVDAFIRSGGDLVSTAVCTFSMSGHSVNYSPNGGSNNVPEGASYADGDTVKVRFDRIPTRSGGKFLGWSADKAASEAEYTADGKNTFVIRKDVTLYAVWTGRIPAGTEFTAGHLKYSVISSDPAQASVIGYTSGLKNAIVPASVEYGGNVYEVASVGEKAFYGSASLVNASVSAPVISQKAFGNCASLKAVALPSVEEIGAYAFYGCGALTSAKFSEDLASVGSNAFGKAQFLVNGKEVPATAKNLAGKNFAGSDGKLRYPSVPVGKVFAKDGVKYTVVSLDPASVDATGFSAGIKAADIPASVTYGGISFPVASVAEKAFYGCPTLESLSVSAPAISQKAFANCASLKILSLTSVKEIGAYAFYGCGALTSAGFSEDLASVGASAFGKIQFLVNGKEAAADAGSLSGKTFSGSDGKLRYSSVPVGKVFAKDSVKYTVVSLDPASVDATGFSAGIKSASIPASVTYSGIRFAVGSVAEKAFYGCPTLESLSVSAPAISQKAFANCAALKTIALTSVKEIGAYAFYGCGALASAEFAKDLASVGSNAFGKIQFLVNGKEAAADAGSLSGKTFSGSDGKLLYSSVPIGKVFTKNNVKYTVTSLDPFSADATGFASGIKSASIPASVTYSGIRFAVGSVAEKAFYGCPTLESLSVSAPAISQKAFANCAALKTIALTSVKEIGAYAFYGCDALGSAEFSGSLSSVGSAAFSKIQFFAGGKTIAATAKNLAGKEFSGSAGKLYAKSPVGTEFAVGKLKYTVTSLNPYEASLTGYSGGIAGVSVPGSVSLGGVPADVVSIGSQAFLNCKTLTYADLGDAVSVGHKAFAGCSSLRSVQMHSVKDIGSYAFYGCKMLTVADLPGTGTVGAGAFSGCTSLKMLDMPEAKTIGAGAFSGCTGLMFVSMSKDLAKISSDSFSKVNISKGTASLAVTAKNMAGHIFAGTAGNLKLVV